jgi:hypothetical protein
MRKNILKFIIIFSLIFNISNSKVFAQNLVENLSDALGIEANKIKGEKLEKLITENYILIGSNVLNGGEAVAEWEFNKDKTYSLTINKEGYREGYNSRQGRWELFGLGNSNIRLYDDSGTKSEMYFEKDGYYRLSQQTYSYRLENKNERIKRLAQIKEEKRIAEEQRLKKIEEEKRQLADKREQERIKAEEIKKQKEIEEQQRIERENQEKTKLEREKLFYNILISLLLVALIGGTYYFRKKIINFLKEKTLFIKKINFQSLKPFFLHFGAIFLLILIISFSGKSDQANIYLGFFLGIIIVFYYDFFFVKIINLDSIKKLFNMDNVETSNEDSVGQKEEKIHQRKKKIKTKK